MTPQTYPLWAVIENRAGGERPRLCLVVGWEADPDQPENYAAVLIDQVSSDGVAAVSDLGGDGTQVHLYASRVGAETLRDALAPPAEPPTS